MPSLKLFGALLIGIVIGVWIFREPTAILANQLSQKEAENARLRLFNAREVRRFHHPAATVNTEAVSLASHVGGVPASVIAAIWTYENGPKDIETGVLGKTLFISKNVPMDYWPAFEAARTINVYTYKYLLSPEGDKAWKAILEKSASAYTGNTRPKEWAKSVYLIEKELRK